MKWANGRLMFMGKKSLIVNKEQNEKRLRIIFRFMITASVTVILALVFMALNVFVTDLYKAFVYNFIAMSFLYAAALILCSFFLYGSIVITIFNPQRLKKSSVMKFAFGGIFTLIITIFILNFSVNETIKSIQDTRDYSNGEWQVKELLVKDVYRGPRRSRSILIQTIEGDMTLHGKNFRIYEGKKYRFTYLDATKTIIGFEKITD